MGCSSLSAFMHPAGSMAFTVCASSGAFSHHYGYMVITVSHHYKYKSQCKCMLLQWIWSYIVFLFHFICIKRWFKRLLRLMEEVSLWVSWQENTTDQWMQMTTEKWLRNTRSWLSNDLWILRAIFYFDPLFSVMLPFLSLFVIVCSHGYGQGLTPGPDPESCLVTSMLTHRRRRHRVLTLTFDSDIRPFFSRPNGEAQKRWS